MIIYVNFPNPHITVHGNPNCGEPFKNQKSGQRKIPVTPSNALSELAHFLNGTHRLAQSPTYRDLYLIVSLNSPVEENAFVQVLNAILLQVYPTQWQRASIIPHC